MVNHRIPKNCDSFPDQKLAYLVKLRLRAPDQAGGQGVRATVADDPNFTVERTKLSLYDNRGRMLHMITPEGTTSYNYDDLGRKTHTAINADLSGIASPTGVDSLPADPAFAERVTAYGYDILGRLVSVQEDATPSDDTDATQDTDYGFDLQGRMASVRLEFTDDLVLGENAARWTFVYACALIVAR